MGQNAITYLIGADAAGFTDRLQKIEADAIASGKRTTDADKRANDLRLAGAGKLKRELAGVAESILSGASASDVLAQAALNLGASLKGALGGTLAIGGAALLVAQIKNTIDAAHELDKAIRQVTQPTAPAEYRSFEGIETHMTEVRKQAEALQEKMGPGFLKSIKNDIEGLADHPWMAGAAVALAPLGLSGVVADSAGGEAEKKHSDEQERLNASGQADAEALARKMELVNDLERKRLDYGEAANKFAQAEIGYKEKLGALAERTNAAALAGLYINPAREVAALEQERVNQQDAITQGFQRQNEGMEGQQKILAATLDHHKQLAEQLQRELKLQTDLNEARRSGNEAAITTIQENAKLSAQIANQERQEATRAAYSPSVSEVAAKGAGRARTEAERYEWEAGLAKAARMRGDKEGADRHTNSAEDALSILGEIGALPPHEASLVGIKNSDGTPEQNAEAEAQRAAIVARMARAHPHRDRPSGEEDREAAFDRAFPARNLRADVHGAMAGQNGGWKDADQGFRKALKDELGAPLGKIADALSRLGVPINVMIMVGIGLATSAMA